MAEVTYPRSCRMASPDGRFTKLVSGTFNITTLMARGWVILGKDGEPVKGYAIATKDGEASIEARPKRKRIKE